MNRETAERFFKAAEGEVLRLRGELAKADAAAQKLRTQLIGANANLNQRRRELEQAGGYAP